MARIDPHSVTDDAQPRTRHLEWKAHFDFEQRRITATAALHFHQPAKADGPFDVDARTLHISKVTDLDGELLTWEALPPDPILGTPLRVHVRHGSKGVRF